MVKYNFPLDMNSLNSNSVILRNIKSGSNVLEIGSSNGRMTEFLKKQLNCYTTIVEVDEESGRQAAKYADFFFIGREANIEDLGIFNYLGEGGEKYDYIIFADVLEHLKNPQDVLKKCYDILDDKGSIWISVPNFCHNAIIIEMINDNFHYRDIGLLDSGHIHMFSHSSLTNMIYNSRFKVVEDCSLKKKTEDTELGVSYFNVPEEVSKSLKKRPYGEIYQFVWRLNKIK